MSQSSKLYRNAFDSDVELSLAVSAQIFHRLPEFSYVNMQLYFKTDDEYLLIYTIYNLCRWNGMIK
jgi:hypothetical protein